MTTPLGIENEDELWDIFFGVDSVLRDPIPEISSISLTNSTGEGLVDILLEKLRAELLVEYNEGRITGAEYTKAFQAMLIEAMAQAVQFTLQKDVSRWQAQEIQLKAIQALYQSKMIKAQIATEEKKQGLLAEQTTNTTEQTNLYKQQIKSFKARDHIQGLGLMQSTWAAYTSISPEVAPIPTWASSGLNNPGTGPNPGFTAEMETYLTKAKTGNF